MKGFGLLLLVVSISVPDLKAKKKDRIVETQDFISAGATVLHRFVTDKGSLVGCLFLVDDRCDSVHCM